jgi:hypothetical protein
MLKLTFYRPCRVLPAAGAFIFHVVASVRFGGRPGPRWAVSTSDVLVHRGRDATHSSRSALWYPTRRAPSRRNFGPVPAHRIFSSVEGPSATYAAARSVLNISDMRRSPETNRLSHASTCHRLSLSIEGTESSSHTTISRRLRPFRGIRSAVRGGHQSQHDLCRLQ